MLMEESLVEGQVESLQLFAAFAEPGYRVQVQVAGHEQRSESDLLEVGGAVDRHIHDLPVRSRQLDASDVGMHAGQEGIWPFVAGAGTDFHQRARVERRAAATALMKNAAARVDDADHAHQLVAVGAAAARRSHGPDQPRKPAVVGALSDHHPPFVHWASRSRITLSSPIRRCPATNARRGWCHFGTTPALRFVSCGLSRRGSPLRSSTHCRRVYYWGSSC